MPAAKQKTKHWNFSSKNTVGAKKLINLVVSALIFLQKA